MREFGKAQLIREKFPFVDILFGTHNLYELGELIDRKKSQKKGYGLNPTEPADAKPCKFFYVFSSWVWWTADIRVKSIWNT